ncbi:MAG: glycosyltransferase family 2 protein [Rhodospirillaceae bacterium]|jgi:dolichol-phosphate mannosyltransferase|nr:glycosyltransferase family 2 protein [Rhodospirillaceae bacterium]MBT4588773.1 glycosyltransferase family 2 protein [Rhodospirillaceae bacterium]MBT5940182.1 glycosyltransferase family 2 protein [Rhodospirillaceae bacterium]MBT7267756.1 glycosyltransferase family 2 protein [Rhodospirillaceae bacterium]
MSNITVENSSAIEETTAKPRIAVVIPCYRETRQILAVLGKFDAMVDHIIVIDDACPDKTGEFVRENFSDPRLHIVIHENNQGVGGATLTGYDKAIELGADIIVKVDGDGQMDPAMIKTLIRPILRGEADYAKGNRFYRLNGLSKMPVFRLIGNLALSFASKMSSGYWKIFDPTNGFTAIHSKVAQELALKKISRDYFFESDMLFQLNIARAVVADVPIQAIYGEETSSLKISRVLLPFFAKHFANFCRRIAYNYFLRDFSIASVELVVGVIFITFGVIFGGVEWYKSSTSGITATAGTVIIAALPLLVGSQLLISFLNFDVHNQPDRPLHPNL